MQKAPNFLFVGPDKAGSSWLHAVLAHHPDVYLTPAKDLYYFDRYYERGIDWYLGHFAGAQAQAVVGEICHDYLFSAPAAQRIASDLPGVRVMVSLRDPVERARSAYLNMRRNGWARMPFEGALTAYPELIDNGRYGAHLAPYREALGRDRMHVAVFDDLKQDPQRFLDGVTEFLGIARLPLGEAELAPVRAASTARNELVARTVKRLALIARDLRMERLIGRVKSAPIVERALYRRIENRDETNGVAPAAVETIRAALRADLEGVERDYGVPILRRWGWLSADDLG